MWTLALATALAAPFPVTTVEVTIDAPPAVVWDVLVDLPAYSSWNPWLTRAAGRVEVEETVLATVVLGAETREANHKIIEVVPEQRLCWQDLGWYTALARGWRCRTLEALPDGRTRFSVALGVNGAFSSTVEHRYGDAMRKGLAAETEALSDRAEAKARAAAR